MDPLSVIFVPGAVAAALALLSPVGVLALRWWQRRGRGRNGVRRCARCAAAFSVADELYWFGGLLVCAGCATTVRRCLVVGLPALAVTAGAFAVSSGTALAVSVAQGGPGLEFWLASRWIPLLLPSAGLAAATGVLVALGKRANRLAAGSSATALHPGRHPDAIGRMMTQLRLRARDA